MIPYTTERRADTGLTNVSLGIWLFLASEVMLFGALFSAYALLRVNAPAWPSGRDVLSLPVGLVNTVLLVGATALIWRARHDGAAGVRGPLVAGSIGSVLFLLVKAWEWSTEISAGLVPSTNTFLAMYYTLTGLHAAHVIGGLIANLWVLAGRRHVTEAMTAGRMQALSLYWAFVDVVWFIVLVLMYLS